MTQTTTSEMTYANLIGWSDITPYEIVRRVSAKTVEVRKMNAEIAPDWTPDVIEGGFAGHTRNNHTQAWVITPDEAGSVRTIRLHKDGTWRDKYGSRFRLAAEPVRFYDFNF